MMDESYLQLNISAKDALDDGVGIYKPYTFYYDECNNFRLFGLTDEKKQVGDSVKFNNPDYWKDFVLGGIARDGFIDGWCEPDEELIRIDLFKNIHFNTNLSEFKFKSQFKKLDFINTIGNSRIINFLKWLNNKDYYIHYIHVNNLYYTLDDIVDSLICNVAPTIDKISALQLKTEFYNLLSTKVLELSNLMVKFEYPEIEGNIANDFCQKLNTLMLSSFIERKQKLLNESKRISSDEIAEVCLLTEMLLFAPVGEKLIFLGDEHIVRTPFIIQDDYSCFYSDRFDTFINSKHIFDYEKKVVNRLHDIYYDDSDIWNRVAFIDSKKEKKLMVQLSDYVAGLIGRMISFLNLHSIDELCQIHKSMSNCQKEGAGLLEELIIKSDKHEHGFMKVIAPLDINNKREALLCGMK